MAGGTIVACSLIISHYMQPVWGGIVASAPGMLAVILYFLHKEYGSQIVGSFIKNLPLGYISSFIFIIIAHQTLGKLNTVICFILGLFGAFAYTYIKLRIINKT